MTHHHIWCRPFHKNKHLKPRYGRHHDKKHCDCPEVIEHHRLQHASCRSEDCSQQKKKKKGKSKKKDEGLDEDEDDNETRVNETNEGIGIRQ